MALRLNDAPPVGVVACCSWYDEDPALLRRMVASLPGIGVDTLVAVDGRYRLFESRDGGFRSPEEQHVALWGACTASRIQLIADIPMSVYANERDKRHRLFTLAQSYAGRDDWLLWIDADESVGDWFDPDRTLSDHLRGTPRDVAEVTFIDHSPREDVTRYWQIPRFFRAQQFARMGPNHYTLLAHDGSAMWGNQEFRSTADRVKLPLLIEHHRRSDERAQRETDFINQRDRLAPEPERQDRSKLTGDRFPLVGEYKAHAV